MLSIIRPAARGTVLALGGCLIVAGVTFSQSPDPSPIPASSPNLMPDGDLQAGMTYAVDDPDGGRLLLTVPASGWFSIGPSVLGKDVIPDASFTDYDIRLFLEPIPAINLNADPCAWTGTALEPPVGPTVDDLATAFIEQPLQHATALGDVTVGGHAGKKVELMIPDDIVLETCEGGDYARWYVGDDPADYGPPTWGNDQRDVVYLIDVDGARWMIDTHIRPSVPEADLTELEQLIASIRFETPAAAPSAPS
jgi:hypothetical protein